MVPSKYTHAMALLAFAIASLCMITPGISSDDDPKTFFAPTPTNVFSPDETPEFYAYLFRCARKFVKDCGFLAFSAIVYQNATLTDECCDNVVNGLGKCCYDSLIIPVLESPVFKNNASKIAISNQQVWKKCYSVA